MNFGARSGEADELSAGGILCRQSFWYAVAIIAITAVAATVRLYQLDRPSFWGDELRSVGTAGMSFDELRRSPRALGQLPTILSLRASGIDLSQLDPERPETWRALGVNEWNARIGACVVGILTIPILILASRRVLGSHASLFAGLLLALAPWHIVWSQAARFYSLQFLLYTVGLIWYFRWRQERSNRMLVAAVFALVLAFLSQPTALLALAVIAADLAVGLYRGDIAISRREVLLIGGGGAVCVFLLGLNVAADPQKWLKFIAFTDDNGYHYPATLFAGTLYMVQLPVVAVAGLSAIWLLKRERRLGTFLVLAAAIPLLLLSVWSIGNFVGLRYVLITLWWWLALAALGLSALYDTILAHAAAVREQGASQSTSRLRNALHIKALALAPAGVVLAALIVPLYAYFQDGYGYRGRWREAFEYTLANLAPGESIATTHNQKHVAQFYCGDWEVREMKWSLNGMLEAFDSTTWLVFHAETSVRGTAQEWTRDGAELRAIFDLRVPQPIEKVAVYRFLPELAEAHERGLSGAEVSHKSR